MFRPPLAVRGADSEPDGPLRVFLLSGLQGEDHPAQGGSVTRVIAAERVQPVGPVCWRFGGLLWDGGRPRAEVWARPYAFPPAFLVKSRPDHRPHHSGTDTWPSAFPDSQDVCAQQRLL